MSNYIKTFDNKSLLFVRVQPKSSKNEIVGTFVDNNKQTYLKVKITEIAQDGKANSALIKFIASKLGIAKSSISLISGSNSRYKVLEINSIVTISF